jgi:hypothetical protein
MTVYKSTTFAMLLPLLFATVTIAQPGQDRRNTKDRLLDILFPDIAPEQCNHLTDCSSIPRIYEKLIMRFGDTDTQLVVLRYARYPANPGGDDVLVSFSLGGTTDSELSQLIEKMIAKNSHVTDREIAAKLKVNVARSAIDEHALDLLLKDLASIRISPILQTRVALDDYSEYEYWFDAGQESVHYVIDGQFKDAPQDQLAQWMIKFRASVPTLLKPRSLPGASKQK